MTAALAVFLALAPAPQAPSAPQPTARSPVAAAFGNTLASTYPDGRVAKLWLNPDGTFDGLNRKGQPNSGKWTAAGGRLCMKQYKPFFYPFSYCTPILGPTEAAGGWPAKAPTGEPIMVHLVKGRAGAPG